MDIHELRKAVKLKREGKPVKVDTREGLVECYVCRKLVPKKRAKYIGGNIYRCDKKTCYPGGRVWKKNRKGSKYYRHLALSGIKSKEEKYVSVDN